MATSPERLPIYISPGVTKFIDLKDTPDSYSGQAGKLSYIKTTEDGLEFLTQKAVGFESKAKAYLGTAFSLPTSAWTIIPLDTKNFDVLGEFDNVTNYRFTASEAGYYVVTGQIELYGNSVDGKSLFIGLFVNGIATAVNRAFASGADQSLGSGVSDIIYLAAGDYINLEGAQESGVAKALTVGRTSNYLTVHRIS